MKRLTNDILKRERSEKPLTAALFFLVLALAAFCFLSVFSFFTTPFSNCDNGSDSAFFRLVGQGMTKGMLPYRDFFDMKGPFLFFIEYLGQLISYGRVGIFLIQWVNLFLTLGIVSRILDLYQMRNRLLQLGLMVPLAYVAAFSFNGGNLTEELSLVPLFSCLWLCLVFFENGEKADALWQGRFYRIAGAWFGFCFGLLLMIRITNAALLCAIVAVVAADLIISRKIRQLAVCAGMFLAGLAVSVLPAVLFFGAKGLLRETYEAMFVLGFRYSGEKTFLQHLTEIVRSRRILHLFLLVIPCVVSILLRWRGWRERTLIVLCALLTFYAIASGNNYPHYYTLTLPLVLLCELSLAEALRDRRGKKTTLATVLTVVMLLAQIPFVGSHFLNACKCLFLPDRVQIEEPVRDVASRIPEEDCDSVFCYNLDPAWYTYAELFPCIKYCGWQNHYLDLMPEVYDDFAGIFEARPPAWLVLPLSRGALPAFLEEKLDADYQLVYQNTSYSLFHYET